MNRPRAGGAALALITVACAATLAFTTTGADRVAAPQTGTDERWQSPQADAGLAKAGLDAERLAVLVGRIRAGDHAEQHSLLIVRHGTLVLEEYFSGWTPDRLHTQQSVSKSFTSAIVGIAIEEGVLDGVDGRVLDYFAGSESFDNVDDRKRAITLRDLLTMRSGTDYHEGGASSPHSQLNAMSRGWDRFILGRPMIRQPGTRFQYDSGGVILMSSLIRERTGAHADAFAEHRLFGRLGIERHRWGGNAEGHPHLGGGLRLRPRDMARFGELYLRRGVHDGEQIVPADWVDESTRAHVDFSPARGRAIGYGYLWWILEPDPEGDGTPIYSAQGFMGQYIFVIPEHDMVVVATADTRGRDQRNALEFLYTDILPAVTR